jgi:hypothetical protein
MTLRVGKAISGRWRAAFAWSAEWGGPGLTVRGFRRRFSLERIPERFLVYVSADSRYRLWINGAPVGRGPLKGTREHYHYECYDLASFLRAGENVIAAEVRWFGQDTPTSEVHSCRPGFVLQGPEDAGIDTPGDWRVYVDGSIQPDTSAYIANAHNFLGHWERVDGQRYPAGWTAVSYSDAGWEPAVLVGAADFAGYWGESHPHQVLHPRDVPALIEEPRRFKRTWADGTAVEHRFGESPAGWHLAAGAGGEIVLDVGHLTTGYPELEFEGGGGRRVEIIYGECLTRIGDRRGYPAPLKEVRDDWGFGEVHGYRDTVVLPGGAFRYEPFHWRTFWYVKIVVSAGSDPFILRDVRYRFTTYPQHLLATFHSSLLTSHEMWKIGWRTLQLCAHETYEDCPYYEQLNYIADSRLQALCSLVLAGETALPRRTIRLYRDSVRPDGLIHSRVPSTVPQILPYFCLIWILMVEDYWRWVGSRDRAFVRSTLNVVDGILWFYRERLREDGFVGPIPPWSMVDRVPGWPRGEPPAVAAGASTYLTSLYICGLDAAVRLHRQAGDPQDAERWVPLADRLRSAVREGAWSPGEGLFLEGPGRTGDHLSQHSQALAILAGVATAEQAVRILERLTTDPSLYRMKFMQSFYLARALEKAGGYAAFGTHVLDLWREAMSKHVSTWPEYPDPTRSDCHAWSSWISADFVTCVLGIQPLRPGFEELLIAPHTEVCAHARGSAPIPAGEVRVDWRKDLDAGLIHLEAIVPEGTSTLVRLPGLEPVRFPSGGEITLQSEIV